MRAMAGLAKTMRMVLPIGVLAGAAGVFANDRFEHQESDVVVALSAPGARHSAPVEAVLPRWQSASVTLRAGGTYRLSATGRWQVAPACPLTGPGGENLYGLTCWDVGGQLVAGVSHATLIGKIGEDGRPFSVGNERTVTPRRDGTLYLMINDHPSWFHDNSGVVSVAVEVLSLPAVAPAPPAPVVPRRGGGGGGRSGGSD